MSSSESTAEGPVLWDSLSWPELAALIEGGLDTVMLPVGATEQHGPHLPLGMDTLAALAVTHGASARTGIPVLPPISVGCSLGHTARWPGTLSLRPGTLARVVTDIAEWLHESGIRRLVMINGHVTNHAPLRCALEEIRHDFRDMRVALRSLWDLSPEIHAAYHDDAVNFHANRAETALVMAVRPDLVHLDLATDQPDRGRDAVFSYRVDQETASGVVGIPTLATVPEGEALVEGCITALVDLLDRARLERPPIDMEEPR